jgi:histone deacetylase 6
MEDEDYAMGEDTIVVTTEHNGDHVSETVVPSEIFGKHPLSKQEQLPFHSPSKSLLQPTMQQSKPGSHRNSKSPSRGYSDTMSIIQRTQMHRSSPKVIIHPKPRSAELPYATSRTGLVYDPRMRFHAELPDMSINPDDIHPEDPRRIHSIFEEIKQAGLIGSNSADEEEDKCWRLKTRFVTRPEVLLIHTEKHYNFVKSLQSKCITTLGDTANS